MNTVLVTGAGGFIGSYAAAEFATRGWRVFGTIHRHAPDTADRPPDVRAALAQVTFLRADVTDPVSLRDAVLTAAGGGRGKLDAIVHCAGRASDVGRRKTFEAVNFGSVRHLVGLTQSQDVRRFVFISTTDVYGLRDFHGENEDQLPMAPLPRNPYPVYKVAAEEFIRGELPAERFSILRPAQVWGVGDRTLTARIEGFLRSSPCIVHFGRWRGANRWPLAHVRNVAKACVLATTLPQAAGQAINVLDGERTTIDEFTRIVADVFLPGKRFRAVCLPAWIGLAVGAVVSGVSNALNLDHPFADPSRYAVHAVSRNLDFSNRRMTRLMDAAGESLATRDQGVEELRAHAGCVRAR